MYIPARFPRRSAASRDRGMRSLTDSKTHLFPSAPCAASTASNPALRNQLQGLLLVNSYPRLSTVWWKTPLAGSGSNVKKSGVISVDDLDIIENVNDRNNGNILPR